MTFQPKLVLEITQPFQCLIPGDIADGESLLDLT